MISPRQSSAALCVRLIASITRPRAAADGGEHRGAEAYEGQVSYPSICLPAVPTPHDWPEREECMEGVSRGPKSRIGGEMGERAQACTLSPASHAYGSLGGRIGVALLRARTAPVACPPARLPMCLCVCAVSTLPVRPRVRSLARSPRLVLVGRCFFSVPCSQTNSSAS